MWVDWSFKLPAASFLKINFVIKVMQLLNEADLLLHFMCTGTHMDTLIYIQYPTKNPCVSISELMFLFTCPHIFLWAIEERWWGVCVGRANNQSSQVTHKHKKHTHTHCGQCVDVPCIQIHLVFLAQACVKPEGKGQRKRAKRTPWETFGN